MKKIFSDKRISFIYIFTILFLMFGVTYALQSSSLSLGVSTALVRIDEEAYGSTTFDTSNLDFRPILDSEVETSENEVIKIDFQVGGASTNNNDHIIYDIALNDLKANCSLLSPYIKWKLIKNGTEISNGSLDYKFDTIVGDEENGGRLVLTTIQQDLPDYNASKTGYDNYTFYMWFSDSCQSSDLSTCINNGTIADQSALIGQNLSGKVEVELYTESKKELVRTPGDNVADSLCQERYLVNFNLNGGTLSNDNSVYVVNGSTYETLPTPVKTYTATFNTNGGTNITTVNNTINNDIGEQLKFNGIVPKVQFLTDTTDQISVDYTFEGWYKDSAFTEQVLNTDIVDTAKNFTLYAKWSGNSNITLPSTTKAGYEFEGWYSDSNYTNKVGDAGDQYQVISNQTLYAKWESFIYYVKYYDNANYINDADGVIVTLSGRNYYKKYSEPALVGYLYNDSYTGPLLVGLTANSVAYYTSSDTSNILTSSGSFDYNGVTYYYSSTGAWMAGDVTDESGLANRIKYSSISIEEAARQLLVSQQTTMEQQFNVGQATELNANPYSKVGYSFSGWSTSPIGSKMYNNSQSVTNLTDPGKTLNLYAVWTPNSYVVKFDDNYQQNDMNIWNFQYQARFSIGYDSTTNMNTVAVAGDSGWEIVYLPIGTVSGREYAITFDYEVPSTYTPLSGYNGVLYQILTSVNESDNTANAIFNDYIPTTATSNKVTKTINFTGTGSTVYFAFNYGTAADGVTTTLKLGNVQIYSSSSKKYGTTIGEVTSTNRPNYTFDGWYTDASGGTSISSSTTVLGNDVNYYAHWTASPVNVTFEGNKFSTLNKTESGLTISYDANTSYLTLNGTQSASITLMAFGGQSFVEGEQYKISVTYISGTHTATSGGCIATDLYKDNGAALTTRNYSDTGYPNSGTNTSTLTVSSTGAQEATVLNLWLWNGATNSNVFTNYTIKIVITKVQTKNYTIGSTYGSFVDNPTRLGYTFVGWYDGTYKNYPLNYYADKYSDLKNAFGTNQRNLYNHWINNGQGEGRRVASYITTDTVNLNGNTTFYAGWIANTYTATMNANGGTNGSYNTTWTATYGNSYNLDSYTPTRTGYTFAGWYSTASGGTKFSGNWVWGATGNYTFYAHWTRNFTCASTGGTTTYAGKSWTTLANDGNYCTLALNSQSNITGSYNSATTNLTNSFFVSGGADYNDTMTIEKNAGLLAAVNGSYVIDTDGGTTNTFSGVYWTGSGTVYNSNTRYLYSCTNKKIVTGMKRVGTTGSLVYRTGCFSTPTTSTTYNAGSRSADNSSSSLTYHTYSVSATYSNHSERDSTYTLSTNTTTGYGAGTASVVKFRITGGDLNGTTTYNSPREAARLDLYECGGNYHGKLLVRLTPVSTSKFHYKNYYNGNDTNYSYSTTQKFIFAGYATNTGTSTNRIYNYATNTTYCISFNQYSINSGSEAIHYRPRIKVKISA